MDPYQTQKFSVVDLAQNPKQYIWELDGQVIPGVIGNSYEYTPACSDVGVHTLKVTITWASHTWKITVNPCPGEWSVSPLDLDFGYIQTDRQVTIQNIGVVPISVTIDRSATAAFVTGITEPANPIAPGETREITVIVDRQGLAFGLFNTSFVLMADSGDMLMGDSGNVLMADSGNAFTVNVAMNVGPEEWSVSPQALDFGYIETTKPITIQNTGQVPISVTIDRSATAAFVTGITEPANPIEPGETREITVTVDRHGLTWGPFSTSFVLKTGGGNAVTVPVTMNISEEWSATPQALDFGYIQTTKPITIQNTGEVPISVTIDRSATAAFVTGITNPANPIAPGQTSEITVTVDRQGLAWGLFNTSFVLKTGSGKMVTVNVAMNVGTAKVLFTVDTSGSMAQNDPQDKRVSAVKETINKFIANENVSFGIIDFDTTARTLTTGFIRDEVTLKTLADTLANDNGNTNYLGAGSYPTGALNATDTLINENEIGTHFVVIFLSDGEPTVGNTLHDPIVAKVSSIVAPGNVKLYTIYLNGDPTPVAQTLLNDMAIAGGTSQTHVYTDPSSLSFLSLDF